MTPFVLYCGLMETSEVCTSFDATPAPVRTVVTAWALVLSSEMASLAVGSVTSMPTEMVRRFGVPVASPVPWTVSLGDDPPQVGLAAATGSAAADEQAAATTPAASKTTSIPIPFPTRAVDA